MRILWKEINKLNSLMWMLRSNCWGIVYKVTRCLLSSTKLTSNQLQIKTNLSIIPATISMNINYSNNRPITNTSLIPIPTIIIIWIIWTITNLLIPPTWITTTPTPTPTQTTTTIIPANRTQTRIQIIIIIVITSRSTRIGTNSMMANF